MKKTTKKVVLSPKALSHLSLGEVERQHILMMLDMCDGNRTATAAVLEIGLRTLQRKLRRYGISLSNSRVQPTRSKQVIGRLLDETSSFGAVLNLDEFDALTRY